MSVKQRVEAFLADIGGWQPTSLSDDARLVQDLGFDSLDLTILSLEVEDHFGVDIPDEEWWDYIDTVGDIVRILERKLT